MSAQYEKLKRRTAGWVLKSLYTNELWFDTNPAKKNAPKNYLFIPLFDLAQTSTKYDIPTIKDACYLLNENGHINIWSDDYDSRAMLIQLSEEGAKAYKQFFYGHDIESVVKKSATAMAAAAMFLSIVVGINKYGSILKSTKNQYRNSSRNDMPGVSQNPQLH
jgi:hypothetical protein